MDDLLQMFPRKLVALVVGPFLLGIVGMALLLEPTPAVRTAIFVLFVTGVFTFVFTGVGLLFVARQSRGIDEVDVDAGAEDVEADGE